MQANDTQRYVVSVLLPDRVAILRDISSAVSGAGGNIDGISQTVVAGYFQVVLTVTISRTVTAAALRATIGAALPDDAAAVVVEKYAAKTTARTAAQGARYVVTAGGRDRAGILKTVTGFLAARGINIEDWHVDYQGGAVTHIGEVTVPARLDIKQVQDEFRHELATVGLTGGLQHENIFRATHEIGPIRSLLGGERHD
jgi:glycine cleavage system transcriptional repressor